MSSCCENKCHELEKVSKKQAKVLWTVLVINLFMFVVEVVSGMVAKSLALTSDSLDMLGDTLVYGSSLYVINRGLNAKKKVASLKAVIIVFSAFGILGSAVYRVMNPEVPDFNIMSIVALIALAANLICLTLLTSHRDDDVNMSSVWICSRNDVIANTSVLFAAILVLWLQSPWPDLVVGLCLTALFMRSALSIFSASKR